MASSDDAAVNAAELTSSITEIRCELAAAVLFLYDFIITVGDESKYFWSNPFTTAAALFYLNRSIAMVYYVLTVLLDVIPLDIASCIASVRTFHIVELLIYVSPGAFTALRIFALSQSWALTVPIFLLSVFPTVGVNLTRFWFGFTGVNLPVSGCTAVDAISVELAKMFVIISRTSLITADCLAILVTWLKLSSRNVPDCRDKQRVEATPGLYSLNKKKTFAHVLLRDGIIYFVAIGVLNCLQLTFTLLSFQVLYLQNSSYISAFTEPLTVILVSRFLIHLQSVKHRTSRIGSSQASTFERVIGTLDATLSVEDFLGDPDDIGPAATPEVHGAPLDDDTLSGSEFIDTGERETGEVRTASLSEDGRMVAAAGPDAA